MASLKTILVALALAQSLELSVSGQRLFNRNVNFPNNPNMGQPDGPPNGGNMGGPMEMPFGGPNEGGFRPNEGGFNGPNEGGFQEDPLPEMMLGGGGGGGQRGPSRGMEGPNQPRDPFSPQPGPQMMRRDELMQQRQHMDQMAQQRDEQMMQQQMGQQPQQFNQQQFPQQQQFGMQGQQQGSGGSLNRFQGQGVRSNNGQGMQSPVHVTVVQQPVPIIVPITTVASDPTNSQQTRQVNLPDQMANTNTTGLENSQPGPQMMRREEQQMQQGPQQLQQGPQRPPMRPFGGPMGPGRPFFGNPNEMRPNGPAKRKKKKKTPKNTENLMEMDLSEEQEEESAQAEEKLQEAGEQAANPQEESGNQGKMKRDCLSGDCEETKPASKANKHICRGKSCNTKTVTSLTKDRRHVGSMPSLSGNGLDEPEPTHTVVTEKHNEGASSNDVVCQLNNVPKVPSCIANHPWKETVKQPIQCESASRQWRCYCGFFEE